MTRFILRYKTTVIAIILMLVSLSSMSFKINTERFHFRTLLFSIIFSVENSLVVVGESIKNVFINVKRIRTLETRLESTELRLLRYRELIFLYDQLQKENETLRNMLKIRSQLSYPAHYSKVIFRDPTLLADYIIINKGSKDGIKLNMPVVCSSENSDRIILVGKIVEVAPSISKVRLITAKNLYLGVRLAETGYSGIVRGQGSWNQNIVIEYIPIEASPKLGEEVVSSGESEIYPPGLLVGKIRGIGQNVMEEFFQLLYVQPEFEYKKLSDVFVLEYNNNLNVSDLTDVQYER